jgi:hypothetical protein
VSNQRPNRRSPDLSFNDCRYRQRRSGTTRRHQRRNVGSGSCARRTFTDARSRGPRRGRVTVGIRHLPGLKLAAPSPPSEVEADSAGTIVSMIDRTLSIVTATNEGLVTRPEHTFHPKETRLSQHQNQAS